jgi:type I restriction enzyme S subunit
VSDETLIGGGLARGLGSPNEVAWPIVRSGEIFELRYGKALTEANRRPGDVPVFGTNGQTGTHDVSLFDGPGVILGRKGAGHLGVHWSNVDYWVIDTAYSLVANEDVDLRYAYYLLSFVGLDHLKHGTSNPSLTRDAFAAQYFPLPPLQHQAAIAATLSRLDEKVSSNLRQVSLLEKLGSALLSMELRVRGDAAPDMAEDGRIEDFLAVLESGSRPKGGASSSRDGVVSLGAENIQSAGVVSSLNFKHVPHEFAASMNRGRLEDGDILVYKDGGRPGNFIPHVSAFGEGFPVDAATINEHVYRVRTRPEISQALLYWILRSPWMDREMRMRGTGVAIPGLNSSNFKALPWPKMESTQRDKLNEILEPMLRLMLRLGSENRRLALLRDTLLPELLSGRLMAATGG